MIAMIMWRYNSPRLDTHKSCSSTMRPQICKKTATTHPATKNPTEPSAERQPRRSTAVSLELRVPYHKRQLAEESRSELLDAGPERRQALRGVVPATEQLDAQRVPKRDARALRSLREERPPGLRELLEAAVEVLRDISPREEAVLQHHTSDHVLTGVRHAALEHEAARARRRGS